MLCVGALLSCTTISSTLSPCDNRSHGAGTKQITYFNWLDNNKCLRRGCGGKHVDSKHYTLFMALFKIQKSHTPTHVSGEWWQSKREPWLWCRNIYHRSINVCVFFVVFAITNYNVNICIEFYCASINIDKCHSNWHNLSWIYGSI